MTESLKGLAAALLAFALFSTHDAIIKELGGSYPVFQIIFFTMLFAFVPMSMMMLADKAVDNFRPRHPWLVLSRAGLAIIAMSCGFYAFTALPLAEVYALLFAMPLLITALSVPLLGETVRAQRWAAVIVGLIGVLIVLRPGVTELTLGHAAALTAAFANSLSTILVRKLGGKERPAVLILYPMILSMMAMSMTLPVFYVPVELLDLGLMAAIGFLGHCPVPDDLRLQGRAGRGRGTASIQPDPLGKPVRHVVLFETPDFYVGLGSAVIIASGIFVVWRESRENVSVQTPVLKTANPRFDTGPQPK